MNKKEQVSDIFQELAIRFFNNRCFVSHKKFKKNSGFSIHHYRYMDDDIKFDRFPKNVGGKLAYYNHLRKRVERNPENFVLIMKMWHTFVDATPNRASRINGLSRIRQEEWDRLKIVVDLTERKVKMKQHFKRY